MTRETAGKRLLRELDGALPVGIEWTPLERTMLASIEVMANGLAALRKLADAAIRDPQASAIRITMLANGVRQLEVSMHGLIKTLDPEMVARPKSERHVLAAMSRWHGVTG